MSTSKLLAVAAKSLHFTFGRAHPDRVSFEPGLAGHALRDQLEKITNRNFLVRSDIKHFAETIFQAHQGQKSAARIVDKSKIARRHQISEFHFSRALRNLRNDRRNDCSGGLPRPVHVKWTSE